MDATLINNWIFNRAITISFINIHYSEIDLVYTIYPEQVVDEMNTPWHPTEELVAMHIPKKGMFEGDLENGELEIGQVSATLKEILPAKVILENLWREFNEAKKSMDIL